MLRNLSDLRGYTIAATDGQIGSIEDAYFDDTHWAIRYLVVDTGGWLPGRLVLVSPEAIQGLDVAERAVHVNLSREQVERSPGIETHEPVSRQHEVEVRKYYGWPVYWPEVGAANTRATQTIMDRPGDPHLQSASDVLNYYVHARDGDIGHVEDFLVDEATWDIRYLVVDTRNWWPGKQVLVAPRWIERVDWASSHVYIELDRQQVETSPEYDRSKPIERPYEVELHEHYGRPKYWHEA